MLAPGDRFLLGVDLVKDPAVLEAAYNDAAGITAEFNRNMLHVLNAELDARIPVEAFEHVAVYNRELARVEMWLRARRPLTLRFPPWSWRSASRPARRCAPRSRASSPGRWSSGSWAPPALRWSPGTRTTATASPARS